MTRTRATVRSLNRVTRANLTTNRIVRSKWHSPYPFYPSSARGAVHATRGNMYSRDAPSIMRAHYSNLRPPDYKYHYPCPLYFSIHHRSRSHTRTNTLSLFIQAFLLAQARDRRVYHLQHRCDFIATTWTKKSRVSLRLRDPPIA